jgi:hypothetical protein
MNRYNLQHRAKCPNGQLMDVYDITLESTNTIMVEDILKTLKEAPDPVFQEGLADHLRNKLGVRVTVIGMHYGVKITCTRE